MILDHPVKVNISQLGLRLAVDAHQTFALRTLARAATTGQDNVILKDCPNQAGLVASSANKLVVTIALLVTSSKNSKPLCPDDPRPLSPA